MPGKLVSRMSERKCFTLSETDTIKSASQNFDEKKVGCMPVLDKNKNVIGILSERDLSRSIYAEKFNLKLLQVLFVQLKKKEVWMNILYKLLTQSFQTKQ